MAMAVVWQGSVNVEERTFNTFRFYSEHQESLTPAGLAFFQSDYDQTLRNFFHNVLNMKVI
jgi:large subunit ribosomal protein L38